MEVQRAFAYKKRCEKADETLREYCREKNIVTSDPAALVKVEMCEYESGSNDETFDPLLEAESDDDSKISTNIDAEAFDYKSIRQPDGRYKCPLCNRMLAERSIRLHMRLHTDSSLLKRCNVCNRGFAKVYHLERHMKSHEKGEFKCTQCNEIFETNYDRRMHFNSEHSNGSSNHIFGDWGADTKPAKLVRSKAYADFKADSARPTQSTNFQCSMCNSSFSNGTALKKHIQTHSRAAEPLECHICQRKCADEEQLARHNQTHMNAYFECDPCSMWFLTKHERQLHRKTVHGVEDTISDGEDKDADPDYEVEMDAKDGESSAGKTAESSSKAIKKEVATDADDDYYNIAEARQPDGRYMCPVCGRSLADGKTLKIHLRLHTGKGLKHCPICNRGFAKSNHLKRHMLTHSKRKYPCLHCPTVFSTHHERRIHFSIEHGKEVEADEHGKMPIGNGAKVCECKICDMRFDKIALLRAHIEGHALDEKTLVDIDWTTKKASLFGGTSFEHENLNDSLLCGILKSQIQKNEDLARFYQITTETGYELSLSDSDTDGETSEPLERHTCSLCNRSFARAFQVMNHMKLHPIKSIPIQFCKTKCHTCDKYFPNDWHLRRHQRTQCNDPNKKYQCVLCKHYFMWSSSHDKHMEIVHSKAVRLYTCDFCGKVFQRPEHLERHRKIHIPSEKRYECDMCHRMFTRKDNLR